VLVPVDVIAVPNRVVGAWRLGLPALGSPGRVVKARGSRALCGDLAAPRPADSPRPARRPWPGCLATSAFVPPRGRCLTWPIVDLRAANFAIRETESDDTVRLHLTGELDIASVPALEERLARARASDLSVCLDLSELKFIESTGLHALIRAMDDANANGWRLQIDRAVGPQVMRLLQLVHFERLIPGYDSEAR
jgi:anti-sigma B factor antagonist